MKAGSSGPVKRARPRPVRACPLPRVRPLPDREGRRLLAVLRALGDRTRLEIYRFVASGRGPVCVCHVVGRFAVSQPTVSHHLKVLREAGLVTVSRRGTWSHFTPAPRGLDPLRRAFALPRRRAEGARP